MDYKSNFRVDPYIWMHLHEAETLAHAKKIFCVCVCVHKFYENFVCRPLLSFELKFKVPKRRMLLLQIYLQNNINVF